MGMQHLSAFDGQMIQCAMLAVQMHDSGKVFPSGSIIQDRLRAIKRVYTLPSIIKSTIPWVTFRMRS